MSRTNRVKWLVSLFLPAAGLHWMAAGVGAAEPADREHRLLDVAVPGIRNYLEFGGAGIMVFDMDEGHRFVERIATPASQAAKPENIKGVCASAATQRLYFTTLTRLYCVEPRTAFTHWEKAL